MAKYAQLHTDDGLAVLKAGLTKEYVLALTFIAQHEDVSIPVREFEKAIKKLAEIGVELSLQRAIGKTLSDNARSKRYYEKTQAKLKESHVRTDVSHDVVPHTNLLPSPIPNPSPAEKDIARKTRKPRAVATFDSWMPKDDHIAIAKERNLNLAAEHIAMRDWLASTGRTYKDYDAFARNWLRRATPQRSTPINTGNYLRQPHPREIPTDPEAARVYWLGEQKDEPRFDFG
jgi:hypothetical protein